MARLLGTNKCSKVACTTFHVQEKKYFMFHFILGKQGVLLSAPLVAV